MNRLGRVIAILFAICLATSSFAVCAASASGLSAEGDDVAQISEATDDATPPSNSETNDAAAATNADAGANDADDNDTTALAAATSATDSDTYGTDIDPVTIYLRVGVDGAWKYVGRDGTLYDAKTDDGYEPITVTKKANRAGGDRAIIPASVLESALSPFGFDADAELKRADQDYTSGSVDWGNFVFGYCDSDTSNIWNDVSPQLAEVDGTKNWYVFTKGREYIHMDTGDKSLDVYYLPANRNDGAFTRPSSFFAETYKSAADAGLIADNTFRTVSFSDPDHRIYDTGEDLPAATYVLTTAGDSHKSVTVKKPGSTAKWEVSGADVESITDNGDGTLTYVLANAAAAVTFTAAERIPGTVTLVYSAPMTDAERTTLGNVAASNQVICENITVADEETKTVNIVPASADETHTILSPDSDIATVYWTQRTTRKFIYTFMGWQVVGTSTVYAPDQEIPVTELESLADASGTVHLKSVWSAKDSNTTNPHIRSVNFYLNLNCEILDVTGSTGSQSTDKFTEAIYATRVSGTDTFGGGNFTLLASNSSSNAYDVDSKLRNSASVGGGIFPPSSWTDYTDPDGVTLEKFPTDEEVLAKARASSSTITIDGEAIAKENITSANFTVRWYVIKYETSDGWHIDGVLVAKKARLVVTKTFEGESDGKAEFTKEHGYDSLDAYSSDKDFHIDVTHEATTDGTTTDVTDYELLLIPDSDLDHTDVSDRRYGYTSYDADSDTYTWEIETRQAREYTVKEKNYYLDADTWNNLTWYEVHNSSSIYNTSGWTEYNSSTGASVKVLAAAYPTDVPASSWQTVGFRNAYVHKGTLAVYKYDHTTGAAMPGVAFEVEQTNADATTLYRKKNTNEYTTDTTVIDQHKDEYEPVSGNKALTNANGVFYLALAAPSAGQDITASYKLTEDKDTAVGYECPDYIAFTMTYEGGIADGQLNWEGGSSDVDWAKVGNNQFILNIYDRSTEYTSVTAKKQWSADSTAKPVTVQLWRTYGSVEEPVPATGERGTPILTDVDGNAASNEVQLTEDNSWAFSWGSLPLFINNQKVTYSLRETWIGDPTSSDSVAYDAAADPEDGYADYAVTTEEARYATGDMPDVKANSGDDLRALYPHDNPSWAGDDDGTAAYAKHALLMVDNADVKGIISFTKKDRAGLDGKPLAGATFTLYSDEACTKEIESITTGANGVAAFSKQAAGTYYFKEVAAPAGYSFDAGSIYKVVVSNGTPTITKLGDSSQAHVTSVYNKFGAGLNVRKIAGDDIATAAAVSGAEFTLTKQDGTGDWAAPQVHVTASNGMLSFTGVDQGTYTLTETRSPAGYEATEGLTITFSVETDETTGKTSFKFADDAFDATAATGFVAGDDVSTDTNIAFTLTVRNKQLRELPATGGSGIFAQAAAGTALICAGFAAWFVHSSGWRRGGGRRA